MSKHISVFVLAALFLPAFIANAQLLPQRTNGVKRIPVTQTSPASGKEMYAAYCAPCHGATGKGNGPAARLLATHPTNLTMLARSNGRKFPQNSVVAVLRFGIENAPQNRIDMPVWGPVLHSLDHSNPASEQQRISNLTRYLGTMQGE